MRPMTLEERGVGEPAVSLTRLLEGGREQLHGQTDVGLSRYVEEILASGFPALRSLSGRARRFQLDSYLFAMRLTVTCPSKDPLFADRMR